MKFTNKNTLTYNRLSLSASRGLGFNVKHINLTITNQYEIDKYLEALRYVIARERTKNFCLEK